MINDSMTQCRFCSTPIDPGIAQQIANTQEKANQAVSDASYLRTAVIAMWVFLGLTFVPFLPVVSLGFTIVSITAIVLAIRWQVKFNGLQTNDVDYHAARKSWLTSLILLLVAVPVAFIIRPLFYYFIFAAG